MEEDVKRKEAQGVGLADTRWKVLLRMLGARPPLGSDDNNSRNDQRSPQTSLPPVQPSTSADLPASHCRTDLVSPVAP